MAFQPTLPNPLATAAYAAAQHGTFTRSDLARELDFRWHLRYGKDTDSSRESHIRDLLDAPIGAHHHALVTAHRPLTGSDSDVVHPLTWLDVDYLAAAMSLAGIESAWAAGPTGRQPVNQWLSTEGQNPPEGRDKTPNFYAYMKVDLRYASNKKIIADFTKMIRAYRPGGCQDAPAYKTGSLPANYEFPWLLADIDLDLWQLSKGSELSPEMWKQHKAFFLKTLPGFTQPEKIRRRLNTLKKHFFERPDRAGIDMLASAI
ncbi:MAG: hypothetical protein KGL51_05285 [Betaproteobacteria bacterium]|nr:hypothetical protein [Betaproteobacteria bacterium]MDE2122610.1 hypothetical protein [Betaproteobacteria bacterium]MDE2186558.1 hypothetical protein [Betaproteobacteria bacterium]MDE2324070.1 hypothetical protein [Betaproteobacteria bacterium]